MNEIIKSFAQILQYLSHEKLNNLTLCDLFNTNIYLLPETYNLRGKHLIELL